MVLRKGAMTGTAILLATSLAIQPHHTEHAAAGSDVSVEVNGAEVETPVNDLPMVDDRILVPFRAISEELGVDVEWDGSTKQVYATDDNTEVTFTMNQSSVTRDGTEEELDIAPQMLNNRTLLPLRFFAETFDAEVEWNAATRTASIEREEESSPPSDTDGVADEEGSYTATSTPDNLNVRAEPDANSAQVSSLTLGSEVEIVGFDDRWAELDLGEAEGWVHSAYLDIEGESGSEKTILGSPTVDTAEDETNIEWANIGGTVSSSEITNGQTITLATDAEVGEQVDTSTPGIENVGYREEGNQTYLDFDLEEGYSAQVDDGDGYLNLDLVHGSAGGGEGTSEGLEDKEIVIDAGHGGRDAGAEAFGLKEKEIALDVSLYAEEMLEERGADVVMTRTEDEYLELAERVEIAEQADADSFVSIHANAFDEEAHGSETYWHGGNSAEESQELAAEIQERLVDKLQTHNRGIHEGNFHVIRETSMPSALVEVAFVTNPNDAEQLARDSFRELAAEAVVEGIENFYEE
ncbi:N-acetylmuramoyl-L-alanine amidase [Salsuginibacillus kocurii]|uniref:N-acetylmuramoyl-L-alanine amidase n=1 Tax=Salsuginibacillus kocurii TaxID=427078 RepID=UPI00037B83F5|nr:N-acetylmuramoyl-L-alanine amidase [Salsuginibacillus kocurii]